MHKQRKFYLMMRKRKMWLELNITIKVEMQNKFSQRKECVLTAGAVGSPHLLQVSGVGPKDVLEKNEVKVKHQLDGVGYNLQDHLQIRGIYRLKEGTETLNQKYHSIIDNIKMGLEYIFKQAGPLSMAPSQLGAFLKSSEDVETQIYNIISTIKSR